MTPLQAGCPGFSSDCLETLEEIGEENRGYFLESGGERYEYVPCLNASAGHIAALSALLEGHLAGWLDQPAERTGTRGRALAMGAPR